MLASTQPNAMPKILRPEIKSKQEILLLYQLSYPSIIFVEGEGFEPPTCRLEVEVTHFYATSLGGAPGN